MASACTTCPSKKSCTKQEDTCGIIKVHDLKVKNVIAVMSGKGGVGKSSSTVMLAKELKALGYSVGILDADITGPSIPRLFGLEKEKAFGTNEAIEPVVSSEGIKTMSVNYILEQEASAVVWRAPLIASAIRQFWEDVVWGELDYLLIDLPPGTGDVPITVLQTLPITGIVMVSTPQPMVSMIVTKSIDMARKFEKPILGVIENMTYVSCPDCGKKIELHHNDGTKQFLEENDVELLGQLPILPGISNLYEADSHDAKTMLEISELMNPIAKRIVEKTK